MAIRRSTYKTSHSLSFVNHNRLRIASVILPLLSSSFTHTMATTTSSTTTTSSSSSSTSASKNLSSSPSITIRKSSDRGHADHGWLNTYHTFSFADYYDPKYQSYGPLRVINEDKVAPGEGFPPHGHSNYEIFSYVLEGSLGHKDSMGNTESIERGMVQFTTAGTGIQHSEYNYHHNAWVHFLQVWVKPNKNGLKPSYQTGTFPDAKKLNILCPIITPEGTDGTIKINNDFRMFASILQENTKVTHSLLDTNVKGGGRKGYIHVPILPNSGGISLTGKRTDDSVIDTVVLSPGDGAFLENINELSITGIGKSTIAADKRQSEFVLFDFS